MFVKACSPRRSPAPASPGLSEIGDFFAGESGEQNFKAFFSFSTSLNFQENFEYAIFEGFKSSIYVSRVGLKMLEMSFPGKYVMCVSIGLIQDPAYLSLVFSRSNFFGFKYMIHFHS